MAEAEAAQTLMVEATQAVPAGPVVDPLVVKSMLFVFTRAAVASVQLIVVRTLPAVALLQAVPWST
jgi:hypothetical protein